MDEILIQNTLEKYRPMAAEIVPPLLALLRERRALEEEIHWRYKAQRQEFLAAGGPPNQLAPGEPELWAEYRRRYLELARPRCSPGLFKYGAAGSCACPAKNSGLDTDPDSRVLFTMKSPRKAVVELRYLQNCLKEKRRFTLKPGPDGWRIARIDHSYQDEDTWHIDHYL